MSPTILNDFVIQRATPHNQHNPLSLKMEKLYWFIMALKINPIWGQNCRAQ